MCKNTLYHHSVIHDSNILEPDQESHSVEPDLGPNCLQRLQQMTISPIVREEFIYTEEAKYELTPFLKA